MLLAWHFEWTQNSSFTTSVNTSVTTNSEIKLFSVSQGVAQVEPEEKGAVVKKVDTVGGTSVTFLVQ